MNTRIAETLEMLEEKIESIKWILTTPLSIKKSPGISPAIHIIRRSAGILGRSFPKGCVFENRARRAWKANFTKRAG